MLKLCKGELTNSHLYALEQDIGAKAQVPLEGLSKVTLSPRCYDQTPPCSLFNWAVVEHLSCSLAALVIWLCVLNHFPS